MKKLLGLTLIFGVFFVISSCEPENQNDKVVMIGDSIFALSGEIANELEDLSGESYRSYYVSGAEMENGIVTDIPDQYIEARLEDRDIRTVIMDGGGNDIQIGASLYCTDGSVTTACRAALADALDAADQLFQDMRDDGVENIVYLNYFYIMDEDSKPAFNWMHDQMEALVLSHGGIVVDPMPYMSDDLIGSDNIHPTDEGSQMLANLIWDAMVANNIEQGDDGSSDDDDGIGCN